MKKTWILKGIGFGIAFVAIGGFVVMNLWNWLIPAIFGLKIITFTQALGILVLSKILFGSFRGGGCGRGWGGCGGGQRHEFWKKKMAERMENMTPEEREKMKEKMGKFWSEEK